jgi:hypothetical protein
LRAIFALLPVRTAWSESQFDLSLAPRRMTMASLRGEDRDGKQEETL